MNIIKNFCYIKTFNYDESHDYNHHIAVKNNVKTIIEHMTLTEDEKNICLVSAMVHDIIDSKYISDEILLKQLEDEIFQIVKKEYGENIAQNVLIIINNISYSKEYKNGYPILNNERLQLMRNIVSDADKIESLGNFGIERCKIFVKNKNPNFSEEEIKNAVVQHCFDKLNNLINYIHTPIGIEIAQPLQNEVLEYYYKNI